jgi:hypothetical protein
LRATYPFATRPYACSRSAVRSLMSPRKQGERDEEQDAHRKEDRSLDQDLVATFCHVCCSTCRMPASR